MENKKAEEAAKEIETWLNDEFEQAEKRGGKQYAEHYCDGLNDGYNYAIEATGWQASKHQGEEKGMKWTNCDSENYPDKKFFEGTALAKKVGGSYSFKIDGRPCNGFFWKRDDNMFFDFYHRKSDSGGEGTWGKDEFHRIKYLSESSDKGTDTIDAIRVQAFKDRQENEELKEIIAELQKTTRINRLVPQYLIDCETWADIPGCEHYAASSWGAIKNKRTGLIRRFGLNKDGYYMVSLKKGEKVVTMSVARIIGSLFVPNPLNIEEINHLDLIKTHNMANNLEWSTHGENIRHAFKNRKIKRDGTKTKKHIDAMAALRKKVFAYDPDSQELYEFLSHKDCAAHFKVGNHTISATMAYDSKLRGRYKLFHEKDWRTYSNNL